MRKFIAVAVIAAFAAVPFATAERPTATRKSGVTTHPSSSPKKGAKPCKKPPKRGVKFIIRGVVAFPPDGAGTMLVDITSVNAHAKKALQGPTPRGGAYDAKMVPVQIDRCTFITGTASTRTSARGGRSRPGIGS